MELRRYLQERGPAVAKEVCRAFGMSQPAFSRLIREIRHELVIGGQARSTRYALKRKIVDVESVISIYEVDEIGKALHFADLHPTWPKGFYLEGKEESYKSDWFLDLPYFLDDLRPNGFLGRLVPTRHPELVTPPDIRLWTADHCLSYLTRFETDGIGNLIVGQEALQHYLSSKAAPPVMVASQERSHIYPEMADAVLEFGPVGSSAGGEQPKFLAVRGPEALPVLVKFSPPLAEDIGRRIGDLMICEQIAHHLLREHGVESLQSEILYGGGRLFLEIARFDRVGLHGRRGLLSLGVLDSQFSGTLGNWSEIATSLMQRGIIDESAVQTIGWLDIFGALIANTDRHRGNLSFFTEKTRPTRLAPVYDMLPMFYFPRHGQLVCRPFDPLHPLPTHVENWKGAINAAEEFWREALVHPDISDSFKAIARANAQKIKSLSTLGAFLR